MTIGKKLYMNFGAILAMVLVLFLINLVAVQREHSAKAAASQALGNALGELQHALSGAEAAVAEGAWGPVTAAATRHQVEASLLLDSEAPLRRAHAAWAQLRASASRRPDVDVVLLVLERITAVARGPAEPVPGDAQPTAGDRREQ